MIRSWLTVVLLAFAVAMLASCGGDDDDDASDTENDAATATIGASGATSASGASEDGTFTAEELEQWGQDLVAAIAAGDRDALTSLLTGIVPQERIDEIAACRPDDFSADNLFVTVIVEPPTMRIEGTVDVTTGGNTETKVILWNTELTEVSDGVYNLSAFPSGCPFVFQ